LSLEERRFTVAHEIGHVYMKHWEEHARFMAYIEELERKHGLHVEKQADLFAKHLLKGVNV
ncbi:MAG: ImmA/IrrE family metallo-endopeptidase, partial [Clostridia bacterium]|nr:ImmA/IrrE family metallo-endopeptidase [Clostridia bacterium]